MAASNIKIKLAETTTTKSYELSVSKLYLHHAWREPSETHLTILKTSGHQRFGETVANSWTVHDGPDPKASSVVARAQGSHMFCGDWHNSFTLAFEVDWLKGSTLLVMGISVHDGQWGIVGGTGYFTMAQGYINKGPAKNIETGSVIELEIYATFRTDKPFKDGLIKYEPGATTDICKPSMANPQSGLVNPHFQVTEHNLTLYMHQTINGPNHNQVNIADPRQPRMFGFTNVHDYPIYDSLDPSAKLVARAQGVHTETSMNYDDWLHWSSIVFSDGRFRGSSFKAIGNQDAFEGEWAIVGGTGVFTFAQGTISIRRVQHNGSSNIKEIGIHAFCCTPQTTPNQTKPADPPVQPVQPPVQPYRDGPKGGPGGQYKNEPKREPHRLERFKLNHGNCIVSFEFSYIDKDGNRQTEGPWGGSRVWKFDEVILGSNEFVKEVSGTVGQSEGYTVVTSLKFVTNVQTYGPYGKENGTVFSLPEKKNGNVVGFFGSSGGLLDYIGVFVRP